MENISLLAMETPSQPSVVPLPGIVDCVQPEVGAEKARLLAELAARDARLAALQRCLARFESSQRREEKGSEAAGDDIDLLFTTQLVPTQQRRGSGLASCGDSHPPTAEAGSPSVSFSIASCRTHTGRRLVAELPRHIPVLQEQAFKPAALGLPAMPRWVSPSSTSMPAPRRIDAPTSSWESWPKPLCGRPALQGRPSIHAVAWQAKQLPLLPQPRLVQRDPWPMASLDQRLREPSSSILLGD